MKIKGKFLEFLADILVKTYQIVFAMMVIGVILQNQLYSIMFVWGIAISCLLLTAAVFLFYNGSNRGACEK